MSNIFKELCDEFTKFVLNNKLKEAEKILFKIERLDELKDNIPYQIQTTVYKAVLNEEKKDFYRALDVFQEAKHLAVENNLQEEIAMTNIEIGRIYYTLGKL